MSRNASSRGHILATTMIAVVILTIVVLGAITFTGYNRQAAVSAVHADQMAACAASARRMVISQLQSVGIQVSSPSTQLLTWSGTLPDADAGSTITVGHYTDSSDLLSDGGMQFTGMEVVSAGAMEVGNQGGPRDMTNASFASSSNGSYYRVVVVCTDPLHRQSEVEFLFRYGI